MASEVGDTSAAAAAAAAEPAADGANSTNTATSGAGDKRNDGSHPHEVTTLPARDNSTDGEKRAAMPMTLEQEGVGHHRDSVHSGAQGQVGVSGGEKSGETATGSREAAAAPTAPAGPAAAVAPEPRTRMDTEDGSASTSDRLSKKRPREEGPEKGTRAAAAVAATTEPAGEDKYGEGTAASGEDAPQGSTQRVMVSPDTPKPLEDPLVPEVVSQDLATQEVKRVRRTSSDTGSPQAGTSASPVPAAAQNERAKRQGGQGDGDGGAVTAVLGNGTAPTAQRPQANGSKADEGKKGKEGEGSGPVGQNRREEAESSGHGEPSGKETGGSTGGEPEEAPPPKAVSVASAVVSGAAGGSPAKDTGTKADEGSPKLNGGLPLPSSTSPPPSKSAAMAPPLPPASSADVAPTSPGSKVADASGKPHAGVAVEGAAAVPSSSPSSPPSPSAPAEARTEEEASSDGDEKMGEAGGSDSGARPPAAKDEEDREEEAGAGRGEAKGKGRGDERERKNDGTSSAAAAVPAPGVKRRGNACPDHALPVARTFFDFETVSGLERRLLPEFFTGRSASKTPEMYMQSRNYMVRSYQRMLAADPDGQPFLTGTECRRKLAGDACSILRIHDFLDRFGLINTRAGGKRPATYPVAPPSMHLWTPTPPLTDPLSSRRASGEKGSADAASAGAAAASSAAGRVSGRRGSESGASAAASGAGGTGSAGGYGNDPGAAPRAVQAGFGQGSGSGGGGGDHDEREWHREELLVLMEAAVAHPHQWDAVAHAVGGGRTSAACMRRFLTLAVEKVVEGDDKKPAAASTTEAGAVSVAAAAAAVPPGEGGAFDSAANGGSGAGNAGEAGGTDAGGLRKRAEWQRPAHLGQAIPALVLASALVSNVDPEVLQAAMSAAADAADAIARRPMAAGATGDDSRDSPRGRVIGIDDKGKGGKVLERKSSRDADEEGEDVEMRDVDDGAADVAAAAVAGSGQGDSSPRKGKDPSTIATVANGGRADGGKATPQDRVGASGGSGGGDSGSRSMVMGPELAGAARAAVLSVAGLQARELARQEERRTEALLADLLEARVQRLETKLHCFDELDQVLNTERESLEHDRAEFLLEQARSMLAK